MNREQRLSRLQILDGLPEAERPALVRRALLRAKRQRNVNSISIAMIASFVAAGVCGLFVVDRLPWHRLDALLPFTMLFWIRACVMFTPAIVIGMTILVFEMRLERRLLQMSLMIELQALEEQKSALKGKGVGRKGKGKGKGVGRAL